ncbi:MAG: hypothetical protein JWR16_2573 [Nevskia sp.]|nr:hypothetical protein [Nevskia sp.]
MSKQLLVAFVLFGLIGSAQAFELKVKSDSPVVSEEDLRSAVNAAAVAIGNNIPNDPKVKVTVYTKAIPSNSETGRFTFLHRIELRRVFTAAAPYPYRGWLPEPDATVERYGVADPIEIKAKLDEVLHDFFTRLKPVDPAKGFE